MNLNGKFILLMIFPYLFGASFPQATNQPLSLSISVPEQVVKIGSEFKIKTILTNVTDHVITLHDRIPACDYPVEVRDENGNLAPQTAYMRQLRCNAGLGDSRNVLVTLKPQESRGEEILVTRLYELTRPGNYFAQVLRKIPKDLGGGTVKSNKITVTVTP